MIVAVVVNAGAGIAVASLVIDKTVIAHIQEIPDDFLVFESKFSESVKDYDISYWVFTKIVVILKCYTVKRRNASGLNYGRQYLMDFFDLCRKLRILNRSYGECRCILHNIRKVDLIIMVVVLIPAYKPGEELVRLVEKLNKEDFSCLVVDDGSGEEYAPVFGKVATVAEVIHASENNGKGSALKLGMRNIKEKFPECTHFITADCDGQHKVEDIMKVREALLEGATMVLTERDFKGKLPARSMIGNILSRWVYTILTGHYLGDNQSGLRGFSVEHIDWLVMVSGEKYDYEINMLYYADCQHIPYDLLPVESIYFDGNKSSHFSPVGDTLRIYRRLFTSAAGSIIAGIVAEIAMLFFTFTYGYRYVMITVPITGAIAFFINLGVDALKFQRIHYRDGGRTLLYAAFRYTYYTAACVLFSLFLPRVPLVIAFNIAVLLAVPVRFYLYQFAFSKIFFKGELESRKKKANAV